MMLKLKAKSGILVKAPLPGTVVKINVKVGDDVNTGDTLLIMEAMKMENNIQCETGGKIKSIMITEGENVLQGDILLEIE
jgi:biotin carboxyl carrier protein